MQVVTGLAGDAGPPPQALDDASCFTSRTAAVAFLLLFRHFSLDPNLSNDTHKKFVELMVDSHGGFDELATPFLCQRSAF